MLFSKFTLFEKNNWQTIWPVAWWLPINKDVILKEPVVPITSDQDVKKEVDALALGRKIRLRRRSRGLTLQNVSDLTGLSKSLLSQIENDVIAPPLATLIRISKALGVTIGYFFRETEPNQRISVVRRNDQPADIGDLVRKSSPGGYTYVSLARPIARRHMEPLLVTFDPVDENKLNYYTHPGEEFLHVTEGRLEFIGADQRIELETGDSIYFDSGIPHALRSIADTPSRALVVIYASEH